MNSKYEIPFLNACIKAFGNRFSMSMCEMKCYNDDFEVSSDYARTIRSRMNAIKEHVSRRASIQPTLVTTFGLKAGPDAGVFANTITLDDLFE